MIGNRSNTSRTRRWPIGVGLVGGAAVAAALIGTAAAHADTIDDLLIQAEGDMNDAATLYSGIDASLLPAQQAANIGEEVSALQGQAGLVSEIQSQQDALSEALQSNSQLVSADNQLASASGDLLSAVNTYVNAADAGDYATGASFSGEVTGYFDRLDLAGAELFQVLPAELNAEFTTLAVGFPNIEPITPPTDLATSASAVPAADPTDLLSQATTALTDGNEVLNSIDVSGLDSTLAGTITAQVGLENHGITDIGNLATAEDAITSQDGAFSSLVNDLLTPVDQNINQSAEAILAADQAFDVALSSDTGGVDPTVLVADLGLLAPDYQFLGDVINAIPIDWAGSLF
jgi:hypothetical protein